MLAKIESKSEKRKQHEGSAPEELNKCSDAMHAGVGDGSEMRKEGKKKKKKKKKMKTTNKEDVVCNDFGFDIIQNEAVNVKDYVEVVNSNKKENDQKVRKLELKRDGKGYDQGSKKHRRVGGEATEVKEFSDVKFHDGREKKGSFQLNEEQDVRDNCDLKVRKDKKRRHREDSDKDGTDSISSLMEITKRNKKGKDRVVMGQKLTEKEDIAEVKNGEEGNRTKKIKKGKRDKESSDVEGKDNIVNAKDIGKVRDHYDGNIMEKVNHGKQEKKRKKKKDKDDLGSELKQLVAGNPGDKSTLNGNKKFVGGTHSTGNKKRGREIEACIVGTEDDNKQKRKKVKLVENVSEGPEFEAVPTTKENVETADLSEKSKPDETPKRVRFSGHVEVFPSSDGQEGLVQGKRFSPEEDEMVRKAVLSYIEDHGLGEEGINMILNCKSHRELKGCWKEIAAALPWRPHESVYYRAHVLFERDEKRTWSPEEYELVRRFHEQHGSEWRMLADALGKHRFQVKDTWRRIKLPNAKKGQWHQEEYQTLFDLVNMDLRMKALGERKSKHGMLRDNISWEAISDKLRTRISSGCCLKWYGQLTSSMVVQGNWADADDYRLLNALFNLDACCMEDVDWDNLLDHRSGELCRKRWNQMIRHIGHYKDKSFAEQVEVLSQRYCPDLLEAREAYDAKVPVC